MPFVCISLVEIRVKVTVVIFVSNKMNEFILNLENVSPLWWRHHWNWWRHNTFLLRENGWWVRNTCDHVIIISCHSLSIYHLKETTGRLFIQLATLSTRFTMTLTRGFHLPFHPRTGMLVTIVSPLLSGHGDLTHQLQRNSL